MLDAVHLRVRNPPLTSHGRRREPLQDRGGGRHAVWEDGAPARFCQGLLPRGECHKSQFLLETRQTGLGPGELFNTTPGTLTEVRRDKRT